MLNLSVLNDPGFCPHSLNKYASIMACGNGYMGIRAAHEENYTQQTRGMYLAGLYHRAGRNETNELINVPDITGMDIELDGINFTLLSGEIIDWQRELDFANGELRRRVVWRSPDGKRYRVESRRFVSLDQLPLVAMQLSVTPLDAASDVMLSTGIDATQTNSGRQHLDEISVTQDACALAKAGVSAALAECAAALHRDERDTHGDQLRSCHANALG